MNTAEALSLVESAGSAAELFPDLDSATQRYRELALLCHPDRAGGGERSTRVFARLSEMYRQRVNGGVDPKHYIGEWALHGTLARGGLADVFEAEGPRGEAIFKVCRELRDNPLLAAEAAALNGFRKKFGAGEPHFLQYLPELFGSALIGGRRANILSRHTDCYSMHQIAGQSPFGKIPFVHLAWMGNRVWEILGAVHRQGLLHGSILPSHLLYRPRDHGLVLIDWTSSISIGKPAAGVRAKRWLSLYPPETQRRATALGPPTDIYMAARSLETASGWSIPGPFRGVFEWATAESPRSRPQDAWEVRDAWRDACLRQYGEPRFVPLDLPAN